MSKLKIILLKFESKIAYEFKRGEVKDPAKTRQKNKEVCKTYFHQL